MAYDAAHFAKGRAKGDIIEIVDRATGTKLVMLEDGKRPFWKSRIRAVVACLLAFG